MDPFRAFSKLVNLEVTATCLTNNRESFYAIIETVVSYRLLCLRL